ncbi:MAG: hypothetical protein O3B13_14975 [Planctomycetota bacterium]|nr:hypothetical protein [Planctomycetota bacterium]MDA1164397.1 hypothetical protein [Planctomycetota bacterium]
MSRTSVISFQNRERDRVAKQGGNVVTYFCTPDEYVLGWVVGPVSSDNLIAEAKLARNSQQVLDRWLQRDVETQREQMREHFLSQLHPANRQDMRLWTNFKAEQRSPTDETVARTVSLAKGTRDKTLAMANAELRQLIKAGRYRSPEVQAESTRVQNALKSDLSRMVIADLPLLTLDQVQRSVFEALANQAFEPRSARNDEFLATVNRNMVNGRLTILEVSYDLHSPVRDDERPELLDRFTVLKLTTKELTRLSDDLGHAPVESSRDVMRFVLLNGKGERTGIITQVFDGRKVQGYRSVLRASTVRPQRRLDTLLLDELQLALIEK